MNVFDDVSGMEPLRIWDGVSARTVHGEKATLAHVELDPNGHVPEHRHEAEQLGVVIRGSLTFRVGDETKELGPGATWCIPSQVPHEAWAGAEGAILLEFFSPRRADWDGVGRDEPRPPRWPTAD
jgi:quercetin dioxygenase-like cupin family protein